MEIIKSKMINAFPKKYNSDVLSIFEKLRIDLDVDSCSVESFQFSSEIIEIPFRLYFSAECLYSSALTDNERRILIVYFTRHHNGYIRHQCLKELVKYGELRDYELAYIMLLIGEYVLEIIRDAFLVFQSADKNLINMFICENRTMINYQHARIISYWNEYYRKNYDENEYYSNWNNYIGSDIIKYLQVNGY